MNGDQSIKKWILGMGQKAKVLGPETLKKDIEKEMRQMLQHYLE
ncbi:WCX domain-containing protein [Gracilibacillus oryzae]